MVSTLKAMLQATPIEELDRQLCDVRQSIQSARDVLAMAIDAPAIGQAMADLDSLSKEELRLDALRDLTQRRAVQAKAQEAASKKAMVDEASDAAIAALTVFAEKDVQSMLADMGHIFGRFIVLRNAVLASAAAAKNVEAVRRAQNSTNVLSHFIEKTMRPLTGVRSSYDPTHGRSFADYLREES
jgi:hypothetical protein